MSDYFDLPEFEGFDSDENEFDGTDDQFEVWPDYEEVSMSGYSFDPREPERINLVVELNANDLHLFLGLVSDVVCTTNKPVTVTVPFYPEDPEDPFTECECESDNSPCMCPCCVNEYIENLEPRAPRDVGRAKRRPSTKKSRPQNRKNDRTKRRPRKKKSPKKH